MPNTQHHPLTERFYELPGVTLHGAEAGTGPLVILLHGFPDFWYTWRHLITPLAAAGYRVVAPDMRGYNLSDKPKGLSAYRLDTLADDVANLIASLGQQSAVVVGHDWGGVVAWHTALKHPQRVAKLAILNAPPPLPLLASPPPAHQLLKSSYIAAFQLPLLPEAILQADDFAALRKILRDDAENPEAFTAGDLERYVTAWGQPGALTASLNYYRALGRYGIWDGARALGWNGGYAGPTLVLWGWQDPHLDAELADLSPERVPQARVVRFPKAGHWVHLDQPLEVETELKAFLGAE